MAAPSGSGATLAERIAPHLPYLRRYARALSGGQPSGDAHVAALLEALIEDPSAAPAEADPKIALYAAFQKLWSSSQVEQASDLSGGGEREQVAQERLATLTPRSRQALLLTAVEGFTTEQAARIMEVDAAEVAMLVESAVEELKNQTRARVLIIEDEPIIAMDIGAIVEELGHRVVATADTRDTAVAAAEAHRPDLVLADIQLADGSSGVDAVREILSTFSAPVIFITAFPERLLTGQRPEPTFLISKPFMVETVQAAISQALFFRARAAMPG